MGFTISESIPALTVLVQGFLSFFSPCVLPLLPVYIGYLSGGTLKTDPDGNMVYDRKKVLVNTIFFVIGIGFAFFLLGLGLRIVGRFFSGNQMLFAQIGGVIIIAFGLFQLGIIGKSGFLSQEHRLPFGIGKMAMSPIAALIMGFVFSFAWTPCVGPTLSSVLLMAASADSGAAGFGLIAVYTAGFVIPFLMTGFFTTTLLSAFRRHKNVVRYTAKIGGILLIFMGVMMLTGLMNNFTGYLSRISGDTRETAVVSGTVPTEEQKETAAASGTEPAEEQKETAAVSGTEPAEEQKETAAVSGTEPAEEQKETVAASGTEPAEQQTEAGIHQDSVTQEPEVSAVEEKAEAEEQTEPEEKAEAEEQTKPEETGEDADVIPAPDFTLTDQYGKVHSLSDYRGKIVFLNFWATWCPPCRAEMPDIQALYEETQSNPDSDLVILGAAFPGYGSETDEEGIRAFLEENGYTYPVLMDTGAELLQPYYITAYPTTFMIDPEGNVFGYVAGSMTRDIMDDIIRQTREGSGK